MENKLFEIEKILNKKTDINNETQYLIKWKGLEQNENSWQKLELLIEDKAFDAIIEFEKSEYAKSLQMNNDTKLFLDIFEEYSLENSKVISNYGDFPIDSPLQIIKIILDEETNQRFALIKWKCRSNGNQPLDSWVNVKVLICFDGELLYNFLKNRIIKNGDLINFNNNENNYQN